MIRNHLSPATFPYAWASDWGEDRYGLWQAFTYKDVRHAFRWIQPGTFMMGSPKNEEGRYDSEDLHQVTLKQGFWLAETTVTQALWQIIMGENPSDFKDDNRPVQNVSWHDTQVFIGKLNQIHSDLNVRLPWEAEWEYACRAGTQTLFNFDGDVNLDRVNYSRIVDDSGWSENVKKAVAVVKSYPCNSWGLYEMHGNVWEWCEDVWRDHLGENPISDPVSVAGDEQDAGTFRVLRGGSWLGSSRNVRSAIRDWDTFTNGHSSTGFRLALAHRQGREAASCVPSRLC